MEEIRVFGNDEFGEVKTTVVDEMPMFCLTDICRVLEITNVGNVKSRLNAKGVRSVDTLTTGGKQKLTYIDEPNLYRTVFQSRKESAERFTDWVTEEVLPSIRRTGSYSAPQGKELLALAVLEANKTIEEQKHRIEQMRPKEIFADAVSTSRTSILIGDLVKLLKQNGYDIGQKRLFDWLRSNGFLIKSGTSYNMPTQRAMEMGLFEVKESTMSNPDGSVRINRTTKVTGKGQIYFINKFLKKGSEPET